MHTELHTAFMLHQQGQLEEAKRLYQAFLEKHPQDLEALVLLAMVYIQENDYTAALPYFLQAETVAPDHAQIQVHLGNTYKLLQQDELALAHYQQALTLKPEYAEAHHNLANLYVKMRETNKAIEHYQQAITLKNDYVSAYDHLALLYLQQKNFKEAKIYFYKTYQLAPNDTMACYHLGNFSLEENDFSQALQYYEAGLQQQADYLPILINLAATHLKMNDKDKAIAVYRHILTIDADDATTHMNLAAIYLIDKDYQNAIKHYSHLLQIDKTNFNAHFNMGVIFMDKECYDIASEHFQSAVALLPDNADAHYNYATCLLKQNLQQTALYHLQQAAKLAPDNAIFRFRLAAVSGKENPSMPPEEYIETLFDRYAERFDKDLVDKLNYQAPKLLSDLLKKQLVDDEKISILDLGCGTGLCGEQLRPVANTLLGIDLSSGMLEIAKSKSIYDELICGDILTIFKERQFQVDAIIAADVCIYFGDLFSLFSTAWQQVKVKGCFIFSCEEGIDDDTFHLTSTGRYQHGKTYVTKILQQTHWQLVHDEAVTLRQQQGKAVLGRMYLCHKN